MGRFTVIVIALVLAPGLSSARPEGELINYPLLIEDEVVARPRPLPILPEFSPEAQPEFELDDVPESEIAPPKLISINPCDACFQHITALIDQLTEVAVPEEIPVHPELPEVEFEPEVPEIGRPLPIPVDPEGGDLRPLPLPVSPEVEVNPIPIPVAPEAEIRPLPIPVSPEVGIRPIPFPLGPLVIRV